MAKKNSEARSGSPERNGQKEVRIDIDFEDLLAAAVLRSLLNGQKSTSLPPDASRMISML
jgi:hypothetical protein